MLRSVHVQMMRAALGGLVSARAFKVMVAANLGVDAVWNQLGRHELHFDANAFAASYAYMDEQRGLIVPALEAGRPEAAWQAFGRLTHTAQDFYSHSNYVDLWLASHAPGRVPPAAQIEPLKKDLLDSPSLRSGTVFLPIEILCYVPWMGESFRKLASPESHARMNLDSPARGPKFEYAYHAAVKRTRAEYGTLASKLPSALMVRLRDLPT